MPTTKQVSYRNDKEVLVKVYVEKKAKERNKSSSSSSSIIHQTVTQELVVVDDGSSSGSRRSRLLMHSRLLRNSARGDGGGEGASSMLLVPNHSQNNNIQTPTHTQANTFKKKPKHAGMPSCFGNWKFSIPSFLRSWSNYQKKEKIKQQGTSGNRFKKLQVSKGKGFIPKVFSKTWKCA